MIGLNIDLRNPNNVLSDDRLDQMPVVRFVYNVSNGTGNTDLSQAVPVYSPLINRRAARSLRTVAVLNHQTYGEGQGLDFDNMGGAAWGEYIEQFASFVSRIMLQHKGQGVIWQVWNEQDQASTSAIGVPVNAYQAMLEAIRSVVPVGEKVSTGGVVSGMVSGYDYLVDSRAKDYVDYVAFHPYGAAAGGLLDGGIDVPSVEQHIAYFARLGRPLLISEFGPLGQNPAEQTVAQYVQAVRSALPAGSMGTYFTVQDGVGGAYGVNDPAGNLRPILYQALIGPGTIPDPDPEPEPTGKLDRTVTGLSGYLNIRSTPSTVGDPVGRLYNGTKIKLTNDVKRDTEYEWHRIIWQDQSVWVAVNAKVTGGRLKVEV